MAKITTEALMRFFERNKSNIDALTAKLKGTAAGEQLGTGLGDVIRTLSDLFMFHRAAYASPEKGEAEEMDVTNLEFVDTMKKLGQMGADMGAVAALQILTAPEAIRARAEGHRSHSYFVYGPAGSGKSFTSSQVARALTGMHILSDYLLKSGYNKNQVTDMLGSVAKEVFKPFEKFLPGEVNWKKWADSFVDATLSYGSSEYASRVNFLLEPTARLDELKSVLAINRSGIVPEDVKKAKVLDAAKSAGLFSVVNDLFNTIPQEDRSGWRDIIQKFGDPGFPGAMVTMTENYDEGMLARFASHFDSEGRQARAGIHFEVGAHSTPALIRESHGTWFSLPHNMHAFHLLGDLGKHLAGDKDASRRIRRSIEAGKVFEDPKKGEKALANLEEAAVALFGSKEKAATAMQLLQHTFQNLFGKHGVTGVLELQNAAYRNAVAAKAKAGGDTTEISVNENYLLPDMLDTVALLVNGYSLKGGDPNDPHFKRYEERLHAFVESFGEFRRSIGFDPSRTAMTEHVQASRAERDSSPEAAKSREALLSTMLDSARELGLDPEKLFDMDTVHKELEALKEKAQGASDDPEERMLKFREESGGRHYLSTPELKEKLAPMMEALQKHLEESGISASHMLAMGELMRGGSEIAASGMNLLEYGKAFGFARSWNNSQFCGVAEAGKAPKGENILSIKAGDAELFIDLDKLQNSRVFKQWQDVAHAVRSFMEPYAADTFLRNMVLAAHGPSIGAVIVGHTLGVFSEGSVSRPKVEGIFGAAAEFGTKAGFAIGRELSPEELKTFAEHLTHMAAQPDAQKLESADHLKSELQSTLANALGIETGSYDENADNQFIGMLKMISHAVSAEEHGQTEDVLSHVMDTASEHYTEEAPNVHQNAQTILANMAEVAKEPFDVSIEDLAAGKKVTPEDAKNNLENARRELCQSGKMEEVLNRGAVDGDPNTLVASAVNYRGVIDAAAARVGHLTGLPVL